MSEKYFSLESIKHDIEWLQKAGSKELLLCEILGRFEFGAIPSADVRPVVRGRWEIGGVNGNGVIGNWTCDVCGGMSLKDTQFCPNCGADMRGGGNK